jgi:hypothetical protein
VPRLQNFPRALVALCSLTELCSLTVPRSLVVADPHRMADSQEIQPTMRRWQKLDEGGLRSSIEQA